MKLTKIVSRDMALGIAFMPVKKEWVQLIPAALSVASSLIGGAKASKAAREAKKEQELGRARNNAWYLRRYNEDFAEIYATYITNTPEGWQLILNQAGENGSAILNQKLDLMKTYFKDNWDLDMDELRDIVLRRSAESVTLDLRKLN